MDQTPQRCCKYRRFLVVTASATAPLEPVLVYPFHLTTRATTMSDDGASVTLNVPSRPSLSRSVTSSDNLSGQGSRIHLQTLKNTLLKSHGRPPWYVVCKMALINYSDKWDVHGQVWRGWHAYLRCVRHRNSWCVIFGVPRCCPC